MSTLSVTRTPNHLASREFVNSHRGLTMDAQFLKNVSTLAAGVGVFTQPAHGGLSEIQSGVLISAS
jgi:hypothetical protein